MFARIIVDEWHFKVFEFPDGKQVLVTVNEIAVTPSHQHVFSAKWKLYEGAADASRTPLHQGVTDDRSSAETAIGNAMGAVHEWLRRNGMDPCDI
ncbi:hypothetical protein EO087_01685 [Dyella sp. M7H15-1]|uniref:hypothetical protein n=1 Tax=Dyella sp. M7H15-1 TaxID=2501295 RepID=UPI00100514E7|nr:hypothetical protein [Dyella sp. M7H15-1]QAU22854.1 hypothetical protein EO087_01685 [Dyella sp. M7H15-1]